MAFLADIRHWPTVEAFEAHLAQYDPAICDWVEGETFHHTWSPTVKQWRGRRSIDGLLSYYRDTLRWSAAPHLFIGPDGVWQLSPLHRPGVHAGICNRGYWGIEVVGDYDGVFWQEPICSLAFGVGAALLRWRRLPVTPQTVRGHRDCNSPKTCPGRAVDMAVVRAQLTLLLAARAGGVCTPDSPILSASSITPSQAARYILSRPHGDWQEHDIAGVIIPAYAAACAEAGVDLGKVIGQMIHETGNLTSYWAAYPQQNPAGIGVNGIPGVGLSFPTWERDAIPAHVGRLLAYALPAGQGTPAQQALVAKALSYRSLPAALRGTAPTLKALGAAHNPTRQGWAYPGTEYGARIAAIVNVLRGMPA